MAGDARKRKNELVIITLVNQPLGEQASSDQCRSQVRINRKGNVRKSMQLENFNQIQI